MSQPVLPFRLFLALPVPPGLAETLSALRPLANLMWTRPEDYHLKLRRSGGSNTMEEAMSVADRVGTRLDKVLAAAPVTSRVTGMDMFPLARVLFVDVELSETLRFLHEQVDSAVTGVNPEPFSQFHSHITVARHSRRAEPPSAELRYELENELTRAPDLAFQASRLDLVVSSLLPKEDDRPGYKLTYVSVAEWSLKARSMALA